MKTVLMGLIGGSFLIFQAQAEEYIGLTNLEQKIMRDATFTGPTTLKEVIARSMTVMGPLEFHELKVEKTIEIDGPVMNSEKGDFGTLEVNGPFMAQYVMCKTLKISGPVEVSHLKVEGGAEITGPLTAKDSSFHTLKIASNEISLEDVEVNDIIIEKSDEKPVLHLGGKTVVKGDIRFESENGVIEKGHDVKIQGKVKGAEVKNP